MSTDDPFAPAPPTPPRLDAVQLLSAVEGSASAILMVDRDLVVTYANPSSQQLFLRHVDTFRRAFPGFDPKRIVGTCIDTFHQDPSHQRRLLSDPRNLPHTAKISIGDLHFRLNISAMVDPNGSYIGSTLEWADVTELHRQEELNADYAGQVEAIGESHCMAAYGLDGRILEANANFRALYGYDGDQSLRGRPHSDFVEPAQASAHQSMWEQLRRGDYQGGVYKRIGRDGREVWIQATYNPIRSRTGDLIKIVEFSTDVTESQLKASDHESQLAAISKTQAVIEFDLDGTIRWANPIFLEAMGSYTLAEVKGRHHSIFVDESTRQSEEYRAFWERLGRGENAEGRFPRVTKQGRTIWIVASYNPILDLDGRPYKVVKFARLEEEVSEVVKEVVRVANALREGDLTQTMEGDFTGRFGELQAAMNEFIHTLGETLGKTRMTSRAVDEATLQLRRSSEQLANGAAQQQASLQVSSEALTETSAMVQATSENASRANELVQQTATTADSGRDKMVALTQAMQDIATSSGEISKIIKVIDEIAFQTNLLAVNAAVEAARAGRHGRGFAVVAQEVRSLAGRSAKAAQATAELIAESSKTVERGVTNVDQTASALEEIRERVLTVRDIVAEISDASAEQSRGVAEVRQSIDAINASAASASRQSAHLASEANGLQAEARDLKEAVDGFVLREPGRATDLDDEVMTRMADLLGVEATELAAFADARRSPRVTPVQSTNEPAPSEAPDPDAMDDERGYASF